jgi:AcrR family transcriptional regulator
MASAAERLMSERGIGAVSLRAVMMAAGQRNKSAAQYHFGSRDGLVAEILRVRMGPVNEHRLAMLREYDAGERVGLRYLMECLIVPLAAEALSDPASHYARFLAQSHADPVLSRVAARTPHADSWRMWIDRTMACLTHVPESLRRVRVDRVANDVVFAVADWEGEVEDPASLAVLISDLTDTCVGFLMAPVSQETIEAMRAFPQPASSASPRTRRSSQRRESASSPSAESPGVSA